MTKIPALPLTVRAWLLEGPLAAHVPAYVARLRRGDYATNTSARCLSSVAHFAHWMSMCRLPVGLLAEGCIEQFLCDHLPRWCVARAARDPCGARVPAGNVARGAGYCTAASTRRPDRR